jgi:hypothetical protein
MNEFPPAPQFQKMLIESHCDSGATVFLRIVRTYTDERRHRGRHVARMRAVRSGLILDLTRSRPFLFPKKRKMLDSKIDQELNLVSDKTIYKILFLIDHHYFHNQLFSWLAYHHVSLPRIRFYQWKMDCGSDLDSDEEVSGSYDDDSNELRIHLRPLHRLSQGQTVIMDGILLRSKIEWLVCTVEHELSHYLWKVFLEMGVRSFRKYVNVEHHHDRGWTMLNHVCFGHGRGGHQWYRMDP